MLMAHNPEPLKLFEDAQLQLCISKSQLMLSIEHIQATTQSELFFLKTTFYIYCWQATGSHKYHDQNNNVY